MTSPQSVESFSLEDTETGFAARDRWEAVEEHAGYDEMRLRAYAKRGANAGKIAFLRIGGALAMRFASIGYFNQIYHLDLAAVERLPELESFYAGSNWRPKVYIAAATDREAVAGRLRRAGFVPDHTVVRLGMRLTPNRTQHRQSSPLSFAITAVAPNEFDEFWHTYLEAFGADPAPLKREDAVANMRLLRCCPGLHFYVAKWEENAVGVGLLRCLGSQASLCGGAVKEPFRNLGAHGGLLAARLQQASDLGAQWISAWADKDGASHRNLVAAGFSLLFEDVVWMRPRASA